MLNYVVKVPSPADGKPDVAYRPENLENSLVSPLGFEAERNSAFAIGVLHIFVVFSAYVLLWDSPSIENRNLGLWIAAQALLSVISFTAWFCVLRHQVERFVQISQIESLGTALTFSGLAWLGPDIATATPSKHVLMIALVAVTSISAANSSHITRRRPFFAKLIVIVACSYALAFSLQGEWVFAVLSLLWCVSIAGLTRVGYEGMKELLELRHASERTARHDDLTGLLGRAAFFDAVNAHPFMDPSDSRVVPALVLFDLDGFKAINDSFGHASGDAVLQAVAKRLDLFLPSDASLGRLGGDEFAAVFAVPHDQLEETIENALAAISEPIRVDDRELYVAASAGWTLVEAGSSSAELMAEADAAMYQSKNSQTTISTGFDKILRDELDRSLEMRQRFRSALKRSEIEFWAQPLVRSVDCAPVAVELLARWRQHDDTMIGPLEFARVADETGLAVELDRKALEAARELLATWAADPLLGGLTVKANISPVHLHNSVLTASVQEIVPASDQSRLGLEFVESRLISAAERNHEQLQELLDLGVELSIDDFGVGYSSLTYLRSLPVSEIKIDRSFVTDVDCDKINQGLIRAIVDIAATLGLPTVAEGVETAGEFAAVTRLGVSKVQGYYVGHPVPLNQIEAALRALAAAASTSPRHE